MSRKSAWGAIGLTLFILTGCSGAGKPGSGSVKRYPLDVCLVTDNDLGSMGDPVSIVHEGQEIKFCCKPCIRKFKADPQKYLAKLNPGKNGTAP